MKRIIGLFLVAVLLFTILPIAALAEEGETSTVAYPVEGGNIYFDPATGAIVDSDLSVTAANIPSQIGGVAVTSIGDSAFRFANITSVTIPGSVVELKHKAFADCFSLTDVTICEGVSVIGALVFAGDITLRRLYLPDGVTEIGNEAFGWSTILEELSIPSSVKKIGKALFANAKRIPVVYYRGTRTQWNSISMGSGNSKLINAVGWDKPARDITALYAGKQIKIKSEETGRYICGENGSQLHADFCAAAGIFEVTPMTADGWVGFRLQGRNYISVTDDGNYLQTTATNYAAWECFRIYEYMGHHYLLAQKDLKYVQAAEGEGRPLKTQIDQGADLADATWERFQITVIGDALAYSGDQYSAVTSSLEYLSPTEADAFIAFIYNKSRSDIAEEKERGRLYDYLTGAIPRGTAKYEYAQMLFLTMSAELINEHVTAAEGRINTSVGNLITFLKSKVGDGSGAAQEIVSGCVADVKSSCRDLLLWVIEDDGTIVAFESLVNGIKDAGAVKGEVEKFMAEVRAILDLSKLVASNNVRKAYAYYINYVNFRHFLDTNQITGSDVFNITCEINPAAISELDAFSIVLDTFGIGNAWTNKDIQHLMNVFAEFTYHSQEEFNSYVAFAKETVKLGLGHTMENPATLHCVDGTDKSIVYASSAPDVVSVSGNGTIKANSIGEAVITATASNGKAGSCSVEVVPIPLTGISLDKSRVTIEEGSTVTLTVSAEPADATDYSVSWSSNRKDIATVIGGVVTAVSPGKAVITVITGDGKYTADCYVEVYAKTQDDHRTYIVYIPGTDGLHTAEVVCSDCGEVLSVETEFCEDEDGNSRCDDCGACLHEPTVTETNSNGDGTHDLVMGCKICGAYMWMDEAACYDSDEDGICNTCFGRLGGAEPDTFAIAGVNMTLGNELELNIMLSKVDVDAYGKDLTVKVIHHEYVDGDTAYTFKLSELPLYSANRYYKASIRVAAAQMTDLVDVIVTDEDGNVYNEDFTTSVLAYVTNNLDKQTAKVKTLLVDMVNYGTAAQDQFKYRQDLYANSNLTEAHQALATPAVTCTDIRVKGTNYVGSNLSLQDQILLNFFFKKTDDATMATMHATVEFTGVLGNEVKETVRVAKMSGYTGVAVNQIVLADAVCPVTVTVYNADGSVYAYATDSVESYNARQNPDGTNALYTNIMKFAASALAYKK